MLTQKVAGALESNKKTLVRGRSLNTHPVFIKA
jgi:hypothetical protein